MGLLDRLTTGEGSTLSSNDGITPTINPLVNPETSKNFSLHYTSNIDAPGPGDGSPGYSVTGQEFTLVNNYYQSYGDGINTPLPLPSKLDLTDDDHLFFIELCNKYKIKFWQLLDDALYL